MTCAKKEKTYACVVCLITDSTTFSDSVGIVHYAASFAIEIWKVDLVALSYSGVIISGIDLFVTVPIGGAIDDLVVRFGYKKLFFSGSAVVPFVIYWAFNPPHAWIASYAIPHRRLSTHPPPAPCRFSFISNNCSMVKTVLQEMCTGEITPLPQTAARPRFQPNPHSMQIVIWLAVSKLVHSCWCNNLVHLAMPSIYYSLLTNDRVRMQFFSVSMLVSLASGFVHGWFSTAISYFYGSSMVKQAALSAKVFLPLHALSILILALTKLPDSTRHAQATPVTSDGISIIPALRSLWRLIPYRQSIQMLLIGHFAGLLRGSTMGVIITAILGIENGALFGNLLGQVSMVATIVANAVAPHVESRVGIRTLLLGPSAVGIIMTQLFCAYPSIPFLVVKDIVFTIMNRVGAVAHQVIHYQMIDYDTMYNNGIPRPAILSATTGCLHQYLTTVTGAFPQAILGSLGYANNGGCSCGCGVPCRSPHKRWDCPTDHGYSCNNELKASNPPLFGDPHRRAPCTWQPEAVLNYGWAINLWIVPVLLMCNFYITTQYPLFGLGAEIKSAISMLKKKGVSMDPFTGGMLRLVEGSSESQQALDHFSQSELSLVQDGALYPRLVIELWISILLLAVGLSMQIHLTLSKGQQSMLLGAFVMLTGNIFFLAMKMRALPFARRALYQQSQEERFDTAKRSQSSVKLSVSTVYRVKAWLIMSRGRSDERDSLSRSRQRNATGNPRHSLSVPS